MPWEKGWTQKQGRKYDALVERLKHRKGVRNPYAVAHAIMNKQGESSPRTRRKALRSALERKSKS